MDKIFYESVYSNLSEILHGLSEFYPKRLHRITFELPGGEVKRVQIYCKDVNDLILQFDEYCEAKEYDDVEVINLERK